MASIKTPKAYRTKSGLWSVRLRLGGKSIVLTSKYERDAVKMAERYKMQYKLGEIPSEDCEAGTQPTLRKIVQKYINSRDNVLSPATIKGYESYANNRFKSVMYKPYNPNTDWQSIINQESTLVSAKSVKNGWSLINDALKYSGYDVPDVTLPKSVKKEARFLDPQDVARFIKLIKDTDIELVCLLGLHSLRRSEIMALDKSSFSFDKETGHAYINVRGSVVMDRNNQYIKKETNKTDKSTRTIRILIPRLKTLIRKMGKEPIYKGDPVNMYKKINRFCDENGFERMGHHGFRHSFVVLAFEANLPVYTVMRLGGWSTPNTVIQIYAHLSERQRNEAYDQMGKVLDKYSDGKQ